MRRNLFKFVTLNSFKIVWVVSVVLFTCVIASAQVEQMEKEKAVVQCIENLEVAQHKGEFGKILDVSFTTQESVEAEVRIEKWGSNYGSRPEWVRVSSGNRYNWVTEDGVDQPTDKHSFQIELGDMDANMPGNKYRLQLQARAYKGAVTLSEGIGRVPDRTFFCKKEFTVRIPFDRNPLNNLRLKVPKPKP